MHSQIQINKRSINPFCKSLFGMICRIQVQVEYMTENENVTEVTNETQEISQAEKQKQAEAEKAKFLENFDWNSIGKKHDNYSKDERARLEDLYNNTLSSVIEHEVIDGTVVAKNNREVVVNIGYKSDGIIPSVRTQIQDRSENWR